MQNQGKNRNGGNLQTIEIMTREERYQAYDERIDRYLRNQMDDSERAAFVQEVDGDQELRERLVATALLVSGIAQEGMRREGQAQLDAIKQMSKDEFKAAIQGQKSKDESKTTTQGQKNRWPMGKIVKWATAIAAVAILALCLPIFHPSDKPNEPQVAQTTKKKKTKPKAQKKPAEPTLASLADEFNKPFGNEPDAFVDIRKQIQNEDHHYMMAVVYDIDKVEWPTAKHGPKGANDDDMVKELTDNYIDCTHWYRALAYLKAGDKETAFKELTELKEHGRVEELVNRATALLKRLGQ